MSQQIIEAGGGLGEATQEPLRSVSGMVNLIFLRILQKIEVPWVQDEEYLCIVGCWELLVWAPGVGETVN